MITDELVREHNLSDEEYQRILEILGREPNLVELGIFSAMWSEHCSYKSSRIHLKTFPTKGPRVIQGPGENAGVVDIGDGLAVAFKMESHNHPSFIEPYQGAATGVGGILRDVFTMGARPMASLNSLRFGRLDAPRMKHLVDGVVRGIAGYGNCIGIPTLGGETTFHRGYDGNILVNVFNLGIVRADRIFLGRAEGAGNPVVYVGSKTGRDGIHGATMASEEFAADEAKQKRPTVQVGDPFTEKLLMEACLELFQTDAITGIQDMGAAGSDLLLLRDGGASRQRRRARPLEGPGPRDRDDALRDHALRVAGADAPRREARPPRRGPRDLPQVGARRRRDRARHRLRPRRPLLRGPDRRRSARGAALRPRSRLRPAARGSRAAGRAVSLADRGGAGGVRRVPPADPRLAQRRREILDLGPVRPHGPDQHRRASRRRRGRHPRQGHEEGHRDEERRESLLLHGGSLPRRRHRRGRGGAVGGLHGRAPAGHHRLPELRQPREARGHGAVRGRRARHRGRLPRARCSRRLRQRLALQRDRRTRDPAHAHGRHGGPAWRT